MVNGRRWSCVMRLKINRFLERSRMIYNGFLESVKIWAPRTLETSPAFGVEHSHGAEGWSHSLANGEQMRRPKIRGRDQGSKIFTCKAFWQTSPSIKEKTGWEKTSGANGWTRPSKCQESEPQEERSRDFPFIDQRKRKHVGTENQIIWFLELFKTGQKRERRRLLSVPWRVYVGILVLRETREPLWQIRKCHQSLRRHLGQ